jgi:aspartate racemase
MHIGLIGGIGLAGTITYYRTLLRLHEEAGRSLSLTIVHADLREMIARIATSDALGQAEVFADHIDQLRAGGCEAVAVTAIGGHFCIRELEAISSLPVINAITALDDDVRHRGFRRIGMLGTRTVMDSRLYGMSAIDLVIPPAEERSQIHAHYVAMSIAGTANADQRRCLQDAADALYRDQGAEAILLGGADLTLAFDDMCDSQCPILDGATIHAEAIARVAMAN